jgi:hypothetical protein
MSRILLKILLSSFSLPKETGNYTYPYKYILIARAVTYKYDKAYAVARSKSCGVSCSRFCELPGPSSSSSSPPHLRRVCASSPLPLFFLYVSPLLHSLLLFATIPFSSKQLLTSCKNEPKLSVVLCFPPLLLLVLVSSPSPTRVCNFGAGRLPSFSSQKRPSSL